MEKKYTAIVRKSKLEYVAICADTYAGIYRNSHPDWQGWKYIDRGKTSPQSS